MPSTLRSFRNHEVYEFTCPRCGTDIESVQGEGKCPGCGISYEVGNKSKPKPRAAVIVATPEPPNAK